MHLIWQTKQVVTIDSMQHVDCRMVFGNRSSPHIWCTFMGLIIWITINVWGLLDLLHYMDNAFGYEYDHRLVLYKPYNKYLPSKQAALLTLWDEVGLPHERHKQIFGPTIEIIDFWVDPREMTIMMPTL